MNTRIRFLAMSRTNHLEYREVPFRLTRKIERADRPLTWQESLEEWVYGLSLGFLLTLFTVLLFSMGCSGAQDGTVGPPDGWCDSHQCQDEATQYVAAGEGIGPMLERSLGRWGKATGRTDLGTSPGGIPVIWQEDLADPVVPGMFDCAYTRGVEFLRNGVRGRGWTQVIELDPTPPDGCPAPELSLLHELIHAMAPRTRHVMGDSLFAASTGPAMRPIDALALEALCSGFDCWSFEPELN